MQLERAPSAVSVARHLVGTAAPDRGDVSTDLFSGLLLSFLKSGDPTPKIATVPARHRHPWKATLFPCLTKQHTR